ncbi:MAG: hypothetical protein K0S75_897 [Clostridia bacterium]|jgi:FlaA1/EpsC-like NDP-sugar epimerase|nr:hypothetical protein [Clostridia bacterium]
MSDKQNNNDLSLLYSFAFILYGAFMVWIGATYIDFASITIQTVTMSCTLIFIFVSDFEFLTKRYLRRLRYTIDPAFDHGIKATTVIYNLVLASIFIFFNSMSITTYIMMLSISTIAYLFLCIGIISASHKKSFEENTIAERKNKFSNNQLTK